MTVSLTLLRAAQDDEDLTMNRKLLSATVLTLTLPLTLGSPAQANDIVDFFRALNGPSPRAYRGHVDHDHGRGIPVRRVGLHDDHGHRDIHRLSSRYPSSRRTLRPVIGGRSGLSVSLNFGTPGPTHRTVVSAPPTYEIAPPPIAIVGPAHRVGEIVTCNVALEPHVEIRDACEVSPGAVPMIIAVRDPHLPRFGSRGCVESIVYVEILAPPCPPQRIRVSADRTKVRLDFGRYEVDIVSRNDCVVIDYDN